MADMSGEIREAVERAVWGLTPLYPGNSLEGHDSECQTLADAVMAVMDDHMACEYCDPSGEIEHQLMNGDFEFAPCHHCYGTNRMAVATFVEQSTKRVQILAFNGTQMRIGYPATGESQWLDEGVTTLTVISDGGVS